jgi:UDP-glucose 4-epimerase
VAKLPCELQIRSFREYFGRPDYTILRPHNVYGPRQNISDPYRNVVGIFMRSALDGEPFPIFGDGLQTRSFSFVSQASHAIAFAPLIPAARNGVFNVGDYGPTTVARLAEMVAETMGVPLKIHRLPARKEVLHATRIMRSRSAFCGSPSTGRPLREGLTIMATHVRVTRTPTPCPSPIDIRDGLPPSWDSHG